MSEACATRLDALSQVWQLWATLGAELTETQWTAPSRCGDWDVAALYAHVSAFPRDMSGPLPELPDPGEPRTAVEIIRAFNAPGGIAHTAAETIAGQGISTAAQLSKVELVELFATNGPQALKQLGQADPGLLLPWGGAGWLPIAEALRIVLMESVVHLLDVQRALRVEPAVPEPALRETAALLAAIAPPVEFIEAATGRSAGSPLPVLR